MDQSIRTLIYAAPRMEIEELNYVRHSLEKLMGKEYVLQADTDEESVHKVVSNNLNLVDRSLQISISGSQKKVRKSRSLSTLLRKRILTTSLVMKP